MRDYLSKPVDFLILTRTVAKWTAAPSKPQRPGAISCPGSPVTAQSELSQSPHTLPLRSKPGQVVRNNSMASM